MNVTFEVMESSPVELREVLKQKPQLKMLVPNKDFITSIVAYNNDLPIGVLIGHKRNQRDLFIDHVYVLTDFQNKGIGTQLLKMIAEVAKKKEIYTLSLIVSESNVRAKAVYTKQGFSVDKRSLEKCWIKHLTDWLQFLMV